jgi:hypothetical protein
MLHLENQGESEGDFQVKRHLNNISSYAKRASLADAPLIVDELKHTNRHAKNSIFMELSVSEVSLCFPLNLSWKTTGKYILKVRLGLLLLLKTHADIYHVKLAKNVNRFSLSSVKADRNNRERQQFRKYKLLRSEAGYIMKNILNMS